jgi:hypothetical protein
VDFAAAGDVVVSMRTLPPPPEAANCEGEPAPVAAIFPSS